MLFSPMPMRFSLLVFHIAAGCFAFFALLGEGRCNDHSAVVYRVSFDDVANHYVQIEATFADVPAGEAQFFLPVWTPGSYLVREYARHIDSITAKAADGTPLEVKKTTRNRWTITNPGDDDVCVTYRVYCNELSVRTNFADSEFAFLNGAATFITRNSTLDLPHQIDFELPGNWKRSVTALPRPEQAAAHSYLAQNYDVVVDSPIIVGNPSLHPFTVGGVQHYLVNQGGEGFWDGDTAAAEVAKLVAEHQQMWGTVPYETYYFMNLIAESGGGLEHDNSSVMLTSRWSYRNKSKFTGWLGLVSHEFFHTWNVRRLRPRALVDYEYESEDYFEELWIAEGVTSYYEDLALARCGLMSTDALLRSLSTQIATLQSTPGRNKQSLRDSSHDTWIKFYRPNENSRNTTISYYNKGAVVAFLLDMKLRELTQNKRSLDDVMRALYDRFANENGYTNREVIAVSSEIAGQDLSEWFQLHVNSAAEVEYDSALNWLGLYFQGPEPAKPAPESQNGSVGNAAAATPPEKAAQGTGQPTIDASTSSENGRLVVSRVVEGGSAAAAGINVDDEIIAIEGYRVSGDLFARLRQYDVGSTVRVLVSRRGQLKEIDVQIAAKSKLSWSLRKIRKPTKLQSESLRLWVHKEDASAAKEPSPSSLLPARSAGE